MQLTRMLADHYDAHACRAQHAGDQLCEFAVSDHCSVAVLADLYLFENFASCRKRLGENSCLVRNVIGHAMQVHNGKREIFGERAIVTNNSQHAPPCALRRYFAAAKPAWLAEPEPGTRQINFTGDPSPDPFAILWAPDAYHLAHEFVTERSVKIVISAQNFHIGVADSREANADQGPSPASIAAMVYE